MKHCNDCELSKTFCLAHLNDPTISGCTLQDYLDGLIPWSQIEVEHTIRKENKDELNGRSTK